jgi:hypothetical protein
MAGQGKRVGTERLNDREIARLVKRAALAAVSDFAPKPQRDASAPSVDQVRAVLRATQLPEQRATPAARKSDAVAVAAPTKILRRLSIGAPRLPRNL